jgi:disulfide bond formation protein DsbB
MKKSENILKHSNKSIKPCQNCRIIRIFLLCVLFIVLLGLIKSDQLHYLNMVTPLNAAILIISSGFIMFIFKLAKFLIDKNQN